MSRIAAFFDIDGTIYREGLITELFKKIIKHELVEEHIWTDEVQPAYLRWNNRKGDYDTYLLKMIEVYVRATKGINKEFIEHIANKVITQKGERVYTFTRDRIKWHQEQGHLVIAISGSPLELVREMASKYNMDDYRGTIYQTDEDGRYNGIIIPMWDADSKQKAIDELVEKYDIDLSKSFAYGDTTGDLTMFKAVSYPYAINPTRELIKKVSADDGIKDKINVIVERKDVVYKMDFSHIQMINTD